MEIVKKIIKKCIGTGHFIREREWGIIDSWVKFKKGENVCDIACGSGEFSIRIARKGCNVYGIDLNEKSILTAKKFANAENLLCEFQVGNAENLPYKNEFFDKVICNCSLEHFDNDIKAITEMNRVLKPEGILMLTVDSLTYPINDKLKEKHRKEHHVVNYYSINTLKDKLEKCGFEVCKANYYLTSFISAIFYNSGIKNRFGTKFIVLFPLSYPLSLISDKLFGKKDVGYGGFGSVNKNNGM